MYVRCKNKGFTLVELMTVVAIVAMLVGLLVPSLNMVRKVAKETKQKAQLVGIDQAIIAFRNDDGDYPPSSGWDETGLIANRALYCGAEKLAEALLGWDLLGFHPDSGWRADGLDAGGEWWTYDPDRVRVDDTLYERKGPYLDVAKANAFTLRQLFTDTLSFDPDRFVICDSFGFKKVTVGGGNVTLKAGLPILYYRADTSKKDFSFAAATMGASIYDQADNRALIAAKVSSLNPLDPDELLTNPDYFYSEDYKILDQQVLETSGILWPYRADSYILISAGMDGLYGTDDDITNIGK